MAQHNDLGKLGEELAVAYLREHKFEILFCNWRYSHYEVDIIAQKNGLPHFVEVKLRTSSRYGTAQESVSAKKLRFLITAADAFLVQHPRYKDFRIDVLGISLEKDGTASYVFMEDAYVW